MKYILYARKSTEDDDKQILSIEAQIFELKEFAAKEKLVVPTVDHPQGENCQSSGFRFGIFGQILAACGGEMRPNYFKNSPP